ncbi:unnamed protein product [Moneuplotes crassus]|uniref:Uncharacterized protein n=1 Tax=Euplotes crassus TaxID=5936 RepID=A0AAD2D9U8_EUPCR|nr:unnamed protein product [Moneuplotes crassus]
MNSKVNIKIFKDSLSQECDALSSSDFDECSPSVQSVRTCEEFDNILSYNKGKIDDKKRFLITRGAHSFTKKFSPVSESTKKSINCSEFNTKKIEFGQRTCRIFSSELEDYSCSSTTSKKKRAELRKLPSEVILEDLLKGE